MKYYIAEIDGLRALAVLSVFVFHINPHLLPGGFTGVDVFFVISGYVVTLAASRYAGDNNYFAFLIAFYTRRIARVIPALLVMLAASALLSWMFIPEAWLSRNEAETGFSAIFGLSNFVLLLSRDAYFDPAIEYNPFTHTWSLAVEEQFYLLFPVIFLLWWKGISGRERIFRQFLTPILCLASILYCAWTSFVSPEVAFYMLPARFWELGLGVMMAQWKLSGARLSAVHRNILLKAGLPLGILLIALGFVVVVPSQFPFPGALLPVSGTALVLATLSLSGASGSSLSTARALRIPFVSYIGRISYSLYLWHWPVIVLLRWTIGIETSVGYVVAVTAPFLLASASFHFIEQPLRFRMRTPVKSFGLGGLMVLATSSAMVVGYKNEGAISLSVTRDRQVWSAGGPGYSAPSNGPFADRTVWMIGDSHALAYRRMLREASRQLGFGYTQLHNTCALGKISVPAGSGEGCAEQIESHLSALHASAKPGDILVLASLRLPRLSDQGGSPRESFTGELVSEKGIAQVEQVLARMRDLGVATVIDLPKPIFRSSPFRCSDWFNRANPVCAPGLEITRSEIEALREPMVSAILAISERNSNVIVWDPLIELCGATTCSAVDEGGVPMFFDADHLSGAGNLHLTPSFVEMLRTHWEADVR